MRVLLVAVMLLAASPAHAGDGVKILPLVSPDAQFVAVLDVEDARGSSMFQQGVQLMLDSATDMKEMLALVGLDLKNVDTVLVAGGYGSSGAMSDMTENLMAVVEGGFTKKKVTKALDGLSGVKTKKKRSIKYWVTASFEAAIVGKRLVVTMPGGMAAVIDRHKNKAKGLTKSAKSGALRAALAYTDTRHDAWMISLPPPAIAGQFRSTIKTDMVSLSLGITLASSATFEGKIETSSAQVAADVVAKWGKQVEGLKKMAPKMGLAGLASSLQFDAEDAVLDLDATLTPDELDKVMDLFTMINP